VKIKLDENLPERLVAALAALGRDIDTVRAERQNGQADPNIWSATQATKRFLITQDLDFSDVRRYEPGTHVGLLLVRLARPGPQRLVRARGHGIPNRERRRLARMPCRRDGS
jgi:predicted nuclease of predicted toxin-antitoxin system